MAIKKSFSINRVLLDSENARHGERHSQSEIYEWMSTGLIGEKVYKLATEIAAKGLSPFDTLGVIPSKEDDEKPWIVVEGNRRVAALKFLNSPKLCPDPRLRKQYEQARNKATAKIPLRVEFAIFKDFSDAAYWIQLRHGGEAGGAGVSSWGTKEYDSFLARLGERSTNRPAIELLSYALSKGLINSDQYESIPTTTLYRLLSTPAVREQLGCHVSKGKVYRIADEDYFNRAITAILELMASGKASVTKLKSRDQRKDFVKAIKEAGEWGNYEAQPPQLISATLDDSHNPDADNETESPTNSNNSQIQGGKAVKPRSGTRDRLFTARSHGLAIPSNEIKVHDIVRELATLKHSGAQGTPISVAFLLRALLELSSDNYLTVNPDAIRRLESNTPLREKVKCSAKHMHQNGKLPQNRLDIILRHCSEDGGMLTISTLQRYLHSSAHFPNGETLNSMWSELKDYIIECW
ncbi:hypothetical protein [Pseudomonas aeruginosa]|uniref:hypothetical protein n=1 Tax=Pseudomonas aeruginosa TaxID=287 RepID=UPI0011440DD8|nr:hypothetical protein [Pseudomonas aeruginosa]